MKFKVGDIVRGTKDSIYGITNKKMDKGRIVRIRADGRIDIKVLEHKSKENIGEEYTALLPEFFKLVEYTYEDLKKSPIGTKVTFESGKLFVKNGEDKFESPDNYTYIDNFKCLTNYKFGKIIKIEEPKYTTVYEVKVEILDEVEKRYLKGVIRPFRNKVKSIGKVPRSDSDKYESFININIDNDEDIMLPYFDTDTMYKGMEMNKYYTLKELGL